MRQDFNVAAEKEMLVGLTPTGDEEEDDEAGEMVRGSSDQQVSFEHDVETVSSYIFNFNFSDDGCRR